MGVSMQGYQRSGTANLAYAADRYMRLECPFLAFETRPTAFQVDNSAKFIQPEFV